MPLSAEELSARTAANVPFDDAELDEAVQSLRDVAGADHVGAIDWEALRGVISDVAHHSHKDWARTEAAAARLRTVVGGPGDAAF
eukprot:CAMPEP_0118865370 /NCGR_PEP_ID=MMETSP1163-20130328/9654_1 /TAXON_ID=124430 /ORGANISM="Phaeomonas parva, Strain CCMP2877" /LENGTH=84 /DNA_ID=CAMNT_0006799589 /DNA_START=188 /DNA_END=439 /DNA_ORIENTATION=+